MSKTLQMCLIGIALSLAGPARAQPASPSGDIARRWNELSFGAVRATSAGDAQAARTYAMVNAAMYDAVWGIQSHFSGARTLLIASPSGAPANGDVGAAAAQAAHDVLVALYPAQAAVFDGLLASDAAAGPPGRVNAGLAWGAQVAARVLAARANDGSAAAETQSGVFAAGQFRASWSGTQFRRLTPFAIANPAQYVSAGPPSLTSSDYLAALAEVRVLGGQTVADPAKLATFQFWNLAGGTAQPPGAWLQIALDVGTRRLLPLTEMTRLLALVSVAMVDTVAPTYQSKFQFHFWRPTTAVREGVVGESVRADADPAWASRSGAVGGSPEHWSGHSSFSAAAATALAAFFCRDDVPFSLTTDSAPGAQPRSYATFSSAALEAGRSRVQGGLHFEFSNQAGLLAGKAIASEVVASRFLLTSGATHYGVCPL